MHATLDLVAGAGARAGPGVGGRRAAAGDPGRPRSGGCSTRPCAFWRVVAGRVHLHRPVAGDDPALGDHAEADDLRPDRRPGRRADRGAARAGRRRAQLGLPLHLGARRLVLRARAAPARLGRRGRGSSAAGWATGSGERVGSDSGPLNIMYRIDGSSDLKEDVLDHWRGLPRVGARCGSATAPPSSCSSTSTARRWTASTPPSGPACRSPYQGWTAISGVLDWLADNWDQPEEGIWETRGGRQAVHLRAGHVLGRLRPRHPAGRRRTAGPRRWSAGPPSATRSTSRSWSAGFHAVAAGVRPALRHRRPGLRAAADADRRLHRRPRPAVAVDPATRWTSELVTDSLVYRYDPAASPDGLRGSEGTFSLCTFAYVDALDPRRPARRRPDRLREDAHLRQPRRAVLRGDRR